MGIDALGLFALFLLISVVTVCRYLFFLSCYDIISKKAGAEYPGAGVILCIKRRKVPYAKTDFSYNGGGAWLKIWWA